MNSISDLSEIYKRLKAEIMRYAPPYVVREGKNVSGKQSLELWAEGDYEVAGRRRKEIYFCGLIIQKSYVGFYYMPIYSDPEAMRRIFSPRLLKCLKGKSCFYIRQLDDELLVDINRALSEGFKLYKTHGAGFRPAVTTR